MQWNVILFQLFYGWSVYRPVFISVYQNQMKLEPPCGVCQRGLSISIYVLGKAWHHSAASNYLYLFMCAMVCSLFIVYFQTFQLKRKTGIWERIHHCHFIVYRLCLVHFRSNISCNCSHKMRLCFGYRVKTWQYICHHITAAGYTARKFCYKARCHLDVPVTVMLSRMNEASLLELLNCVALLTYLERTMKDLCCLRITTNMRFRRLQACCETSIQEVHMYIIG
jgi:hypothetical protein